MLINYLKVAFRNLSKQKLFSFINVFGLALSMSICMLVLLRIKDQMSYDKFHPDDNKLYRIITDWQKNDREHYRFASTPLPLAGYLEKNYNIIDKSVRIFPIGAEKATAAGKELTIYPAFVDTSFFEVFGFELDQGNTRNCLRNPAGVVLTQEMAKRYFAGRNPVGQLIHFEKLGDFLVSGVMKKPAGKSHIDFNAYMSMSAVPKLERSGHIGEVSNVWNNITAGYTYIKIKSGINERQLIKATQQVTSYLENQSTNKSDEHLSFQVQRFNNIILGEELLYSIGNTGSRSKVMAEIGISLIILLSACFNYTNLSIARSLNRGKEVGIRKVSGASRYQVFTQFVVESLLIAMFSLVVAFIILKLIIDFAPFSGEMVPPGFSFDTSIFLWFFLFTLFCGLLAGVLPAWALSSFNPVQVLKNLSTVKLFGGNGFRKALIIIQFALCLVITVFTSIFSRQFNFMASADPGFTRENVISIPLNGANYKIMSNEINKISTVSQVGAGSGNLGINATGNMAIRSGKDKDPVSVDYYDIDSNYIKVMNIALIAGNTFPFSGNNEEQEKTVLINETAAKSLQFKTPLEAVGKTVWLQDSVALMVCGVVKDFYYKGMEQLVTPLVFRNRSEYFQWLTVKTKTNDKATLNGIKEAWERQQTGKPFEGQWLKDMLYEKRSAWGTVSMLGFLSFMTITIACLGLLGMVIYTTETRRKEIGIRKIMGASVAAIMSLLSKGFIRLIIIAGIIALPLSYLLGYFFLNLFANRINLGLGSLVICFLSLLLLVLVVIGTQIYRVAISNPVNSLRTE